MYSISNCTIIKLNLLWISRNFAISKSDFLLWDTELDLNFLLGDYTEHNEDDIFHSDDDKPATKQIKQPGELSSAYECHVCNKILKQYLASVVTSANNMGKHLKLQILKPETLLPPLILQIFTPVFLHSVEYLKLPSVNTE